MRVVKIAGFVIGGLLLLAVIAVVGVIMWVQNGDMRGVASWAVKKQGYDIAFDGPVSVKLWPKGELNVGKVVVLGGDKKPMFETDDAQVIWTWGGGLMPWNGRPWNSPGTYAFPCWAFAGAARSSMCFTAVPCIRTFLPNTKVKRPSRTVAGKVCMK